MMYGYDRSVNDIMKNRRYDKRKYNRIWGSIYAIDKDIKNNSRIV